MRKDIRDSSKGTARGSQDHVGGMGGLDAASFRVRLGTVVSLLREPPAMPRPHSRRVRRCGGQLAGGRSAHELVPGELVRALCVGDFDAPRLDPARAHRHRPGRDILPLGNEEGAPQQAEIRRDVRRHHLARPLSPSP